MDPEGTMTMERQDLVGIPANGVVDFAPGGLHVMLTDLVNDLKVGDTFDLTLEFQRAGDITVEVEVKQAE
jgi:copper(I)-binding protein